METFAPQLDILAVIVLHQLLVVESLCVGQVYPESNLHFEILHQLEEHVSSEPVLHRNLSIKLVVQRSLEGEESVSNERD